MEYNWQFSQKSRCSDEDRQACLKLVSELIALSKVARRNGLLSLVPYADKSSSFLLRKGLHLVVDGVNPQVTREVLESYILSGDYSGKDLLERCIILEGVAAIQKGLHPKVVKEYLFPFWAKKAMPFSKQNSRIRIQIRSKHTCKSLMIRIPQTRLPQKRRWMPS